MFKAFTLIELLTVLAVIAILLTIVTSFAVNAVHQARATRVAMNLRNIKAAAESYISVEKPATQTSFDLNFLVSKSYLTSSHELAHYTLFATRNDEAYHVTITYSAIVDPVRLQSVLPGATVVQTGVIYSFVVPIWW